MMILRLDPAVLDGSQATASWNPLRTTIGVPCVSGAVQGVPRIVAGDPGASAIVQLVSMRGVLQMPPIGTRFVDTTDVTKVVDWIQHMPSDAGAADAGLDVAAIVEGGYATTAPDGGYPTEGGATGSQDSGADATVTADVGAEGGASGAENEALDATVEAAAATLRSRTTKQRWRTADRTESERLCSSKGVRSCRRPRNRRK